MIKTAVIDFMCLPGDDAKARKQIQQKLNELDIERKQIISTNLVPMEETVHLCTGKWFMMVILYEARE